MSDATSTHDKPPRCRFLSTPVGADVTETAVVSGQTARWLRACSSDGADGGEVRSHYRLFARLRRPRHRSIDALEDRSGVRRPAMEAAEPRRSAAGRTGMVTGTTTTSLGPPWVGPRPPYAVRISADWPGGPVCRGQRTGHAGRSRKPARSAAHARLRG